MAKIKNLQFNEEGTEFKIIFENGKTSVDFKSKMSGLNAIVDLFKKGKITNTECDTFIKEMLSHNLPYKSDEDVETDRKITIIEIDLTPLFKSLFESFSSSDHPQNRCVDTPLFEVCKCRLPISHGKILLRNGSIGPLYSKEKAMKTLIDIMNQKIITEDEFLKIKIEIDQSSLMPEEKSN